MNNSVNNTRGFAQIITIVFLSAIGMSIALVFLPIGLSSARVTTAMKDGLLAEASARSCGEIALLSLADDPMFSGEVSHDSGGISCVASTETSSLPDDTLGFVVESTGTSQEYTSTVQITGIMASGTPPSVTEWIEGVSF
jgi:hypothetical protein